MFRNLWEDVKGGGRWRGVLVNFCLVGIFYFLKFIILEYSG